MRGDRPSRVARESPEQPTSMNGISWPSCNLQTVHVARHDRRLHKASVRCRRMPSPHTDLEGAAERLPCKALNTWAD